VGEFTARGLPPLFSAVLAGARFRAFVVFLPFFDFALAVGAPFPAVRAGRVHFRLPRAFAYTGGIDDGYPK